MEGNHEQKGTFEQTECNEKLSRSKSDKSKSCSTVIKKVRPSSGLSNTVSQNSDRSGALESISSINSKSESCCSECKKLKNLTVTPMYHGQEISHTEKRSDTNIQCKTEVISSDEKLAIEKYFQNLEEFKESIVPSSMGSVESVSTHQEQVKGSAENSTEYGKLMTHCCEANFDMQFSLDDLQKALFETKGKPDINYTKGCIAQHVDQESEGESIVEKKFASGPREVMRYAKVLHLANRRLSKRIMKAPSQNNAESPYPNIATIANQLQMKPSDVIGTRIPKNSLEVLHTECLGVGVATKKVSPSSKQFNESRSRSDRKSLICCFEEATLHRENIRELQLESKALNDPHIESDKRYQEIFLNIATTSIENTISTTFSFSDRSFISTSVGLCHVHKSFSKGLDPIQTTFSLHQTICRRTDFILSDLREKSTRLQTVGDEIRFHKLKTAEHKNDMKTKADNWDLAEHRKTILCSQLEAIAKDLERVKQDCDLEMANFRKWNTSLKNTNTSYEKLHADENLLDDLIESTSNILDTSMEERSSLQKQLITVSKKHAQISDTQECCLKKLAEMRIVALNFKDVEQNLKKNCSHIGSAIEYLDTRKDKMYKMLMTLKMKERRLNSHILSVNEELNNAQLEVNRYEQRKRVWMKVLSCNILAMEGNHEQERTLDRTECDEKFSENLNSSLIEPFVTRYIGLVPERSSQGEIIGAGSNVNGMNIGIVSDKSNTSSGVKEGAISSDEVHKTRNETSNTNMQCKMEVISSEKELTNENSFQNLEKSKESSVPESKDSLETVASRQQQVKIPTKNSTEYGQVTSLCSNFNVKKGFSLDVLRKTLSETEGKQGIKSTIGTVSHHVDQESKEFSELVNKFRSHKHSPIFKILDTRGAEEATEIPDIPEKLNEASNQNIVQSFPCILNNANELQVKTNSLIGKSIAKGKDFTEGFETTVGTNEFSPTEKKNLKVFSSIDHGCNDDLGKYQNSVGSSEEPSAGKHNEKLCVSQKRSIKNVVNVTGAKSVSSVQNMNGSKPILDHAGLNSSHLFDPKLVKTTQSTQLENLKLYFNENYPCWSKSHDDSCSENRSISIEGSSKKNKTDATMKFFRKNVTTSASVIEKSAPNTLSHAFSDDLEMGEAAGKAKPLADGISLRCSEEGMLQREIVQNRQSKSNTPNIQSSESNSIGQDISLNMSTNSFQPAFSSSLSFSDQSYIPTAMHLNEACRGLANEAVPSPKTFSIDQSYSQKVDLLLKDWRQKNTRIQIVRDEIRFHKLKVVEYGNDMKRKIAKLDLADQQTTILRSQLEATADDLDRVKLDCNLESANIWKWNMFLKNINSSYEKLHADEHLLDESKGNLSNILDNSKKDRKTWEKKLKTVCQKQRIISDAHERSLQNLAEMRSVAKSLKDKEEECKEYLINISNSIENLATRNDEIKKMLMTLKLKERHLESHIRSVHEELFNSQLETNRYEQRVRVWMKVPSCNILAMEGNHEQKGTFEQTECNEKLSRSKSDKSKSYSTVIKKVRPSSGSSGLSNEVAQNSDRSGALESISSINSKSESCCSECKKLKNLTATPMYHGQEISHTEKKRSDTNMQRKTVVISSDEKLAIEKYFQNLEEFKESIVPSSMGSVESVSSHQEQVKLSPGNSTEYEKLMTHCCEANFDKQFSLDDLQKALFETKGKPDINYTKGCIAQHVDQESEGESIVEKKFASGPREVMRYAKVLHLANRRLSKRIMKAPSQNNAESSYPNIATIANQLQMKPSDVIGTRIPKNSLEVLHTECLGVGVATKKVSPSSKQFNESRSRSDRKSLICCFEEATLHRENEQGDQLESKVLNDPHNESDKRYQEMFLNIATTSIENTISTTFSFSDRSFISTSVGLCHVHKSFSRGLDPFQTTFSLHQTICRRTDFILSDLREKSTRLQTVGDEIRFTKLKTAEYKNDMKTKADNWDLAEHRKTILCSQLEAIAKDLDRVKQDCHLEMANFRKWNTSLKNTNTSYEKLGADENLLDDLIESTSNILDTSMEERSSLQKQLITVSKKHAQISDAQECSLKNLAEMRIVALNFKDVEQNLKKNCSNIGSAIEYLDTRKDKMYKMLMALKMKERRLNSHILSVNEELNNSQLEVNRYEQRKRVWMKVLSCNILAMEGNHEQERTLDRTECDEKFSENLNSSLIDPFKTRCISLVPERSSQGEIIGASSNVNGMNKGNVSEKSKSSDEVHKTENETSNTNMQCKMDVISSEKELASEKSFQDLEKSKESNVPESKDSLETVASRQQQVKVSTKNFTEFGKVTTLYSNFNVKKGFSLDVLRKTLSETEGKQGIKSTIGTVSHHVDQESKEFSELVNKFRSHKHSPIFKILDTRGSDEATEIPDIPEKLNEASNQNIVQSFPCILNNANELQVKTNSLIGKSIAKGKDFTEGFETTVGTNEFSPTEKKNLKVFSSIDHGCNDDLGKYQNSVGSSEEPSAEKHNEKLCLSQKRSIKNVVNVTGAKSVSSVQNMNGSKPILDHAGLKGSHLFYPKLVKTNQSTQLENLKLYFNENYPCWSKSHDDSCSENRRINIEGSSKKNKTDASMKLSRKNVTTSASVIEKSDTNTLSHAFSEFGSDVISDDLEIGEAAEKAKPLADGISLRCSEEGMLQGEIVQNRQSKSNTPNIRSSESNSIGQEISLNMSTNSFQPTFSSSLSFSDQSYIPTAMHLNEACRGLANEAVPSPKTFSIDQSYSQKVDLLLKDWRQKNTRIQIVRDEIRFHKLKVVEYGNDMKRKIAKLDLADQQTTILRSQLEATADDLDRVKLDCNLESANIWKWNMFLKNINSSYEKLHADEQLLDESKGNLSNILNNSRKDRKTWEKNLKTVCQKQETISDAHERSLEKLVEMRSVAKSLKDKDDYLNQNLINISNSIENLVTRNDEISKMLMTLKLKERHLESHIQSVNEELYNSQLEAIRYEQRKRAWMNVTQYFQIASIIFENMVDFVLPTSNRYYF